MDELELALMFSRRKLSEQKLAELVKIVQASRFEINIMHIADKAAAYCHP